MKSAPISECIQLFSETLDEFKDLNKTLIHISEHSSTISFP